MFLKFTKIHPNFSSITTVIILMDCGIASREGQWITAGYALMMRHLNYVINLTLILKCHECRAYYFLDNFLIFY